MKNEKCDHIRHQWRGVDLPCAVPGCAEGHPQRSLLLEFVDLTDGPIAERRPVMHTEELVRENILGWGWRLA